MIELPDANQSDTPNCGLYVPTPEEINALGVERRGVHPNFERYDDLEEEDLQEGEFSIAATRGKVLRLAPGTPRSYPPYGGASRDWGATAMGTVRKLRDKAPGIVLATYEGHGRTGKKYGIDYFVAPFRKKATRAQEELGDRLCNWAVRNWAWLDLDYIIWWNWMNDGQGWFDYTPWSKPAHLGGWPGGDPDMNTRRHEDHGHLQVRR